MRLIKIKTHGYLDLPIGIHMVGLPLVTDWELSNPAMFVPMIVGSIIIIYSLFTDYEFGIGPIPMRIHLSLDLFTGALLALSPWLFQFSQFVFLPHLIAGSFVFVVSLLTQIKVRKRQTSYVAAISRYLRIKHTMMSIE
jgi:hypothetical protein